MWGRSSASGRWKSIFALDIKEGFFSYQRDADSIASEASLDGMYAIRSSLKEPTAEDAITSGSAL